MRKTKYYNGFDITTRNAVFSFIISNRNYGKTWCFKRRAFRRAAKHGRKTIWVRRFKKEAKEAAASFYSSVDLQKFCGVEMYDPKTKQGNCRQQGNVFYIRRGKRWVWFLKIVAISDSNSLRGVDDVKVDTIIFDEYRTTPTRYTRYRGDEVTDFIDIFFSAKREHEIRCFFLGNRESTIDPYFSYFGLPAFPSAFEGIRSFRNGSICIQFIDNKQNADNNAYAEKVANLLSGTRYGRYIYENATKTEHGIKIKRAPKNAGLYVQLLVAGQYERIVVSEGYFYIISGVDRSKSVYCDEHVSAEKHFFLSKKLRRFFTAFIDGIIDGRVYYETQADYERIQPFYKWLNI